VSFCFSDMYKETEKRVKSAKETAIFFKIIFVVTFQIFHNFITNIHISLQFFCFIYLDYLYFKKVQQFKLYSTCNDGQNNGRINCMKFI